MATCPVNSPDAPELVCPASFQTISTPSCLAQFSRSGKLCSRAGRSQCPGRRVSWEPMSSYSFLTLPVLGVVGGEQVQGRLAFAEQQAGRGGERVMGVALSSSLCILSSRAPQLSPGCVHLSQRPSGLQPLSEPLSPPHPCPPTWPSLVSQRDPPSISRTPGSVHSTSQH